MKRLHMLMVALALVAGPVTGGLFAGAPARAEAAHEAAQRLADTLQIAPILEVMRDEGLDYARTMQDDMLGGQGGERWQAVVGLIYDLSRMRARFDEVFLREMAADPAATAAAQAFFEAEPGRTIIRLEVEARRAMLEEAAEDAAKVTAQDMAEARDPRLDQIRRLIEANDLVESNVMGALNANLSFYRGMASVGGFAEGMTEEDMLADVWAQEEDVRKETTDWLIPYLALAYAPVSDSDLEAYIAFSETPAGGKLNAALFAAFDALFVDLSQDLGAAAARQMQGQDI